VRLYNPLFNKPEPSGGEGFTADLNPNSLETVVARLEPALADAKVETPVQFERNGYFCLDNDSAPGKLVFNRTIGLRDTWAKDVAKDAAKEKAAR
jgi:glutaminyl-tRNA synthetase